MSIVDDVVHDEAIPEHVFEDDVEDDRSLLQDTLADDAHHIWLVTPVGCDVKNNTAGWCHRSAVLWSITVGWELVVLIGATQPLKLNGCQNRL